MSKKYRSVEKTRRSTSHTFHLLMSLLTCGVWAILIWFPLTMWHKMGPRKKTVIKHDLPPQG